MANTRKGGAGVFQISEDRYVAVRRIKDSPCYIIEECYQCEDAPSGWYSSGTPSYVEASSELNAATAFIDLVKSGEVALID